MEWKAQVSMGELPARREPVDDARCALEMLNSVCAVRLRPAGQGEEREMAWEDDVDHPLVVHYAWFLITRERQARPQSARRLKSGRNESASGLISHLPFDLIRCILRHLQ